MNSLSHLEEGLGILRAVREDLEFGAIGRPEEIVSSGIYRLS
jgi:hypothetical protein